MERAPNGPPPMRGARWVDPSFPPSASSLGAVPAAAQWRRFDELFPAAPLPPVADGRLASGVEQGQLGDCWLLAPLAGLAACLPSAVLGLFSKVDVGEGRVSIRLWAHHRWEHVELDTLLPCDKDGAPLFCGRRAFQNGGSGAWAAIVEKAFAKRMGQYAALEGGRSAEAIVDLTGGIAERTTLTIGGGKLPVVGAGPTDVSTGSDDKRLPLDRSDGRYAELAARIAKWRGQGAVMCATIAARHKASGTDRSTDRAHISDMSRWVTPTEVHTVAVLGVERSAGRTDVLLLDTASAENPAAVSPAAVAPEELAKVAAAEAARSDYSPLTALHTTAAAIISDKGRLPGSGGAVRSSDAVRLSIGEFCDLCDMLTLCWVLECSPLAEGPRDGIAPTESATGAEGRQQRRLWLQHIVTLPSLDGGPPSQFEWPRNPQYFIRTAQRARVIVAVAQRQGDSYRGGRGDKAEEQASHQRPEVVDHVSATQEASPLLMSPAHTPASDEYIGLHVLSPSALVMPSTASIPSKCSVLQQGTSHTSASDGNSASMPSSASTAEALLTCDASCVVADAGPARSREVVTRFVAQAGVRYVLVPNRLIVGVQQGRAHSSSFMGLEVAGDPNAAVPHEHLSTNITTATRDYVAKDHDDRFVLRVWADVPCRLIKAPALFLHGCRGTWNVVSAGGGPRLPGWGSNPQFALCAPHGGNIAARLRRLFPALHGAPQGRTAGVTHAEMETNSSIGLSIVRAGLEGMVPHTPRLLSGMKGGPAVRLHPALVRGTAPTPEGKLADESFIQHHFAHSGRLAANGRLVSAARSFDAAHERELVAQRALVDASAEAEARRAAEDMHAAKAVAPPPPRVLTSSGAGDASSNAVPNKRETHATALEEQRMACLSSLWHATRVVETAPGDTLAESGHTSGSVAELFVRLPAGQIFNLVPSTLRSGECGSFEIDLISTAPLLLRQLQAGAHSVARGAWVFPGATPHPEGLKLSRATTGNSELLSLIHI